MIMLGDYLLKLLEWVPELLGTSQSELINRHTNGGDQVYQVTWTAEEVSGEAGGGGGRGLTERIDRL
jgi:hypothetical protein